MKRMVLSAAAVLCATFCLQAGMKGLVFGHRGGRNEFEENTLNAFRGSYARGTRGFETDVRMTRDGALVILHNDTVKEIYAGDGSVEDMTADEVRALKSRREGQPFLFLDSLLAFLADKPSLYIEFEMKTGNRRLYPDSRIPAYCDAIYKAVTARVPKGSVYVFTSFDKRPLKYLGEKYGAERMLISGGPVCPEIIRQAKELGIRRIGCQIDKTSRAAVREAHQQGMIVTGWPGGSVKDYLLMKALGIDMMCSDVPVKVNEWIRAHPEIAAE